MEFLRYEMPVKIADRLRTTARVHRLDTLDFSRRLMTIGLIIDQSEINGGAVVIKEGNSEKLMRVVRDRPFCRKLLDRFGMEIVQKKSVFVANIPQDLVGDINRIAIRERMSVSRVLDEMFIQGLNIADAVADPGKKVLVRERDHSEREMFF